MHLLLCKDRAGSQITALSYRRSQSVRTALATRFRGWEAQMGSGLLPDCGAGSDHPSRQEHALAARLSRREQAFYHMKDWPSSHRLWRAARAVLLPPAPPSQSKRHTLREPAKRELGSFLCAHKSAVVTSQQRCVVHHFRLEPELPRLLGQHLLFYWVYMIIFQSTVQSILIRTTK